MARQLADRFGLEPTDAATRGSAPAESFTVHGGPQTVGIIMDNTAAPMSFAKPMREGGIEKLGIKLIVEEEVPKEAPSAPIHPFSNL